MELWAEKNIITKKKCHIITTIEDFHRKCQSLQKHKKDKKRTDNDEKNDKVYFPLVKSFRCKEL